MEIKTHQEFDEAARFVLHKPEFQERIRRMISESPETNEAEIFYILIEEARKLMDYNPKTEKGRKDTQRLVKGSLLRDIRRIFGLSPDTVDQVLERVSQSVHHMVPLEEKINETTDANPVLQEKNEDIKKPLTNTSSSPKGVSYTQPLETYSGPKKKLLEFISSVRKITNLASEGDPKFFWTNRFKKEGISLESESSAWKEQFEDLAKTPFSEEFFKQHSGLDPLKEDALRLQELASLVKAWYSKTISPVVFVKVGRENINPYKTPNYYKLSIEEVVDFMKGKKNAKEYLDGLSQVYKYTPNALHKKNLEDILKKK